MDPLIQAVIEWREARKVALLASLDVNEKERLKCWERLGMAEWKLYELAREIE